MRIAIIIPAFNIAPFLRQAVLSVIGQTHTDWGLVIVDDGSTDDTAAVAASFHDSRLRLIRQENAGVSAARNRGIDAFLGSQEGLVHRGFLSARPDAFVFLDGDDWLTPGALAQLAATLECAPWAAAACGRYVRVTPTGLSASRGLAASPREGCLLEHLMTRNLFANGGHLLIRREAIEAVGRFRADLCYGEDWEYWTRISLVGEFVAAESRSPILFVRERQEGAYCSNATSPEAYWPAMNAIFNNPEIIDRVGDNRMAYLRHSAEAEMAWSIGRELIRHGQNELGQHWLGQSVWSEPSLKRFFLMGFSWLGAGLFRRYSRAG